MPCWTRSIQTSCPKVESPEEIVNKACAPFDDPALRETLVEIQKKNEQVIDTISKDELLVSESVWLLLHDSLVLLDGIIQFTVLYHLWICPCQTTH